MQKKDIPPRKSMNLFGGFKNNQNTQQPQRPAFGQAKQQNGAMHSLFQSSNQVATQNQEKVTVNNTTDLKHDGFFNSINKIQQERQQIENEKLKAHNLAINEAVSQGYEPEVLDYQKYLGPDCSLETANSFMQSLKHESEHGQNILQQQYIQRYRSRVKDKQLTIGVDYYLINIQFVDQLDITNLLVSGMYAGGLSFNNQDNLSYILHEIQSCFTQYYRSKHQQIQLEKFIWDTVNELTPKIRIKLK
ncbi:Hypothetical_protein [Hexamita inflata]|uniref:Hypothetical_protein n=1 Tax=Hexamita inflata TaxID=28002 RepID=A0AA86RFL8_9EUKA|nr:Hypothetical protein HINF_LOCUS61468 [Hexamita inflata]